MPMAMGPLALSQGTAGHNVVIKHPVPLLPSSEEGSLKNSAEQLSITTWLTAPGEEPAGS